MRRAEKGRVQLTEEEAAGALARLKTSLSAILAVPKSEVAEDEATAIKRVRHPRSAS